MFLLSVFNPQLSTFGFEGRIRAVVTRAGDVTPVLYTAGTNFLRIEVTDSDRPNPVDIFDRASGDLLLLFPHNRSFVRLKPAAENSLPTPGVPPLPPLPPTPSSVRPLPQPPAFSGAAPLPPLPSRMAEPLELKATGDKTNLLGYVCEKFQVRQRGETMEIWATTALLPFQPYTRNQPHRSGARELDEQCAVLLAEKKLFPLLAILKFDEGAERYRFEVKTLAPEKVDTAGETLFQPPTHYQEIAPLPF